jgi:hypothetical protein
MKRVALTAALVLAGAGVATAQSSGLYTSGYVQHDYLNPSGSSSDANFSSADFVVGYGFGGAGSLPMGVELGVLAFAIDSGGPAQTKHALFPTFWVDTSVGRFSVGAPRSAVGSAIRIPRIGGTAYLPLMISISLAQTDYVPLMGGNIHSYGVRYDGSVGGFDAGLSLHGFTGSASDAHSLTGVIGRDYGAFSFAVGFDALQTPSYSEQTYLAQLGYDAGRYGGHLTLAANSDSNDLLTVADVFYKPIDWLTLNASYLNSSGSDDLYGLNAEVSFLKNGYAGVGYIDGFGGGSDYLTTVYAGWKLNY